MVNRVVHSDYRMYNGAVMSHCHELHVFKACSEELFQKLFSNPVISLSCGSIAQCELWEGGIACLVLSLVSLTMVLFPFRLSGLDK